MPYLLPQGTACRPLRLRQQSLYLFRIDVAEAQDRNPAIFGFDLYRLMSRSFRLFNPNAFGGFDDLGHVRVDSTPYYDVNTGAIFGVCADADKRQSGRFLLIAYVQ